MFVDRKDGGPKKTGDPVIDITAKILYVAPQMTGERELRDGDQAIIDEIGKLRKLGKLNGYQKALLDRIGQFANDTDLF